MRFPRNFTQRLGIDTTGPWQRIITGSLALTALITFGVAGYMIIEGWSFLDALFMTVISVTTVGYQEVEPLSRGGQLFTIFVILFGVGVAFYILTALVRTIIEGELGEAVGAQRMKARIDALQNHYILCGYGRVGEEIATEFKQRKVSFVIIESNAEAIERAHRDGYLIIEGDATLDSILEEAGIRRSRVLMAASDSDAGNTYITLTAKALRPDLYVVARVGQQASVARVRRAGADRVISPYSLAGRRMALTALQPLAVDFIDLLAAGGRGEQLLAELVVSDESLIAGQSAQDAVSQASATTLLAVQHADGELLVSPPPHYVLRGGDRLMLLTSDADIQELGRTRGSLSDAAGAADEPLS